MKIKLLLITLVSISLATLMAFADEGQKDAEAMGSIETQKGDSAAVAGKTADDSPHMATDEELQALPNAGNKTCPVSGEEIKEGEDAMGGPVLAKAAVLAVAAIAFPWWFFRGFLDR